MNKFKKIWYITLLLIVPTTCCGMFDFSYYPNLIITTLQKFNTTAEKTYTIIKDPKVIHEVTKDATKAFFSGVISGFFEAVTPSFLRFDRWNLPNCSSLDPKTISATLSIAALKIKNGTHPWFYSKTTIAKNEALIRKAQLEKAKNELLPLIIKLENQIEKNIEILKRYETDYNLFKYLETLTSIENTQTELIKQLNTLQSLNVSIILIETSIKKTLETNESEVSKENRGIISKITKLQNYQKDVRSDIEKVAIEIKQVAQDLQRAQQAQDLQRAQQELLDQLALKEQTEQEEIARTNRLSATKKIEQENIKIKELEHLITQEVKDSYESNAYQDENSITTIHRLENELKELLQNKLIGINQEIAMEWEDVTAFDNENNPTLLRIQELETHRLALESRIAILKQPYVTPKIDQIDRIALAQEPVIAQENSQAARNFVENENEDGIEMTTFNNLSQRQTDPAYRIAAPRQIEQLPVISLEEQRAKVISWFNWIL